MGIFGGGPSIGGGPSRGDRRRTGARSQSRPAARRDTERRAQVAIIAGMIVVAAVVLGIAGFGYYQTTVRKEPTIVLQVGDRKFDMSYAENRVRYTVRTATPGQPELLNSRYAAYEALRAIESDELNRIGAPQLGLSVSDDEVDAEIRKNLRLSDSADDRTYAAAYRQAVIDSGLSPSQYREEIAATLLEDKIRQQIRDNIADTADQVNLRDIRVTSQDDAQAVLDRLAAGEDFATVAGDVSLDLDTKNKGGEMGWIPLSALDPSIANAVSALEAGQLSQPILDNADGTYYVYQVLEKGSAMPVSDVQRTQIENQSYTNWLNDILQQVNVVRYYANANDSSMFDHLAEIAKEEGAGATPTPLPASTSPPTPEPTSGTP